MSVLTNFSLDANFWELNPVFLTLEICRNFRNTDFSDDNIESSKVMWAIAMLVDTSVSNPYRNLKEDDRKIVIQDNYLKVDSFDWVLYKEIIEFYQELNSSKLEKDLYMHECKLEERAKFIMETPYNTTNGPILDKLMANTQKIYELIDKIKDNIKKENSDGKMKGDRIESASEKGML